MNKRETRECEAGRQSRQEKYCTTQTGQRVFALAYLRLSSCTCALSSASADWNYSCSKTHLNSSLSQSLRFSLRRLSLTLLEFSLALILIQLVFWLLLDLFYFLSQASGSVFLISLSLTTGHKSFDFHRRYSLCFVHFFPPAPFFLLQALLLKITSFSKPSLIPPGFS